MRGIRRRPELISVCIIWTSWNSSDSSVSERAKKHAQGFVLTLCLCDETCVPPIIVTLPQVAVEYVQVTLGSNYHFFTTSRLVCFVFTVSSDQAMVATQNDGYFSWDELTLPARYAYLQSVSSFGKDIEWPRSRSFGLGHTMYAHYVPHWHLEKKKKQNIT